MGSDEELSEDEEEILVYVEFEGLVDGNGFSEKQLQLDMIGVDTEHPIMQINGRFYEGAYEDLAGTYMFFTSDDTSVVNDHVFDAASNLKYFAKTRKFLKMQRIFIKPRTEVLGDSEDSQCIPNLSTLKQAGVPLRYYEQALSFWETMRNDRLNALHLYLEKQRVRQQKKSQGIMLDSESDEDNPFAAYKHKDESDSVNNPEDARTESKRESKENINETLQTIGNACLDNVEKLVAATESKSLISNGGSSRLVRTTKTYKTKTLKKRNATMARNIQRKKNRTKGKILISDRKETELSNAGEKSEQPGRSNVTQTSGSTEIITNVSENENKKDEEKEKETKSDKHKVVAIIGESKVDSNQTGLTDSKVIKQRKREAKMKEISAQLKAIAEEHLKTKVD
ncbi:uncharacterized protein LOC143372194 [Andrena cerasifolii]|uniref:uncharacterized protein LOC143372194 n=1 Tax=Andrena cerasifolii TaxID=2819439 RepID=UPI0040381FC5